MYEIFFNPYLNSIMVENSKTSEIKALNEMEFSFLKNAETSIQTNYPESFDVLIKGISLLPRQAFFCM
jgi:hypothetical protein